MRLKISTAAMAGLALTLAAGTAFAQRGGGFFDDPKSWTHAAPPGLVGDAPPGGGRRGGGGGGRSAGNPLEISEGAALLAKAGVACTPRDGKQLHAGRDAAYEVACKDGFGWIVLNGADGPQAFDCLAFATSTAGERHCTLPPNRNQLSGLQALADRAHTGCKVADGVFLGTGGKPAISRYEAACREGGGYVFDAPAPGSKADFAVTACKDAEAFGLKCTLPGALSAKG